MSRFRYLIERGVPEETIVEVDGDFKVATADVFVTVITPDDDTGKSLGRAFQTVDDAKAEAEKLHQSDGSDDPEDHPLRWKDPPAAWQPDALAVSQYLDDGVEDNRDA